MKSKLFAFVCVLAFFLPVLVFGAESGGSSGTDIITATEPAPFIPLVGIPGIPNPSTLQFGDYINSLYRLAISIAALLAVFKIVIAGAKYMLDDVVTHKQEAKDEIKGALVGLLVILGAVLILNTVNTDITKNIIAIDTLETNSSDTLDALIAEAEKANADAKNLCTLAGPSCQTLYCEGWITNGMDQNPGESEIDACNRTCKEDYRGVFNPNTLISQTMSGVDPISAATNWESSTCTYDINEAKKCDVNNSWNCCEDINDYSWDAAHQMCNTPSQPFDVVTCAIYPSTLPIDYCKAEMTACTTAGNQVMGTPVITVQPGGGRGSGVTSGSILCSKSPDASLVQASCPYEGKVWDPTTKTCVPPPTNQKIFPPGTLYPSTPTQADLDATCVETYGAGWVSTYIGTTQDASSHVCQKN